MRNLYGIIFDDGQCVFCHADHSLDAIAVVLEIKPVDRSRIIAVIEPDDEYGDPEGSILTGAALEFWI